MSTLAPGTVIDNAILTLYVNSAYVDISARKITVHRITSAWVENEATWNRRDSLMTWTMPGGDYETAVDTITAGDAVAGTWVTFNITWLVQEWVDAPASNHGVLIRSEERQLMTTFSNDIMFAASEDATPANRPLMDITYGGAADGDGDGLADAWEVQYFDDASAYGAADDPDGDGADNAAEFAAGTNPDNAASRPDAGTGGSSSDSGCLPGGGYAGFWLAIAAAGWLVLRRRFRTVACQAITGAYHKSQIPNAK